ncbi:MAG: hypothetical protein RR053_07990 [Evtepia sp.]
MKPDFKQELTDCKPSLRSLNEAAHAICIALTCSFGSQIADGIYQTKIPKAKISALLKDYTFSVHQEDGFYLLCATKQRKDPHH